MRFLCCTKSKVSGISYHRLIKPLEVLCKDGKHTVTFFENFQKLGEVECSDYDYLLFNRSLGYGLNDVGIIDKFKNAGVKIILDIGMHF